MEMNDTKKPLTRKDVVIRPYFKYGDVLEEQPVEGWYTLWVKETGERVSVFPIERNDDVASGYWGRWSYGTRDFSTQRAAINRVIHKYNLKHGLI